MQLEWHLLEATLGDDSPWTAVLPHQGVRALTVSIHDPGDPGQWRAAEHGEQKSSGAGFHASYRSSPTGDRVTVWFDGQLRAEPVRIAYAVAQSGSQAPSQ